jgi:hypothetical protein
MVVERLNLLAQAPSMTQLAQFSEGDGVQFTARWQHQTWRCAAPEQKTPSVHANDGHNWKVSPSLLRKKALDEQGAPKHHASRAR